MSVTLLSSSKSDTDLRKVPPPVKPKPVHPKTKAQEVKPKLLPWQPTPVPMETESQVSQDVDQVDHKVTTVSKLTQVKQPTEFASKAYETRKPVPWQPERVAMETKTQARKVVKITKPVTPTVETVETRKSVKTVELDTGKPSGKEYRITFEIPEPERKVTSRTTETRRETTTRSETRVVYVSGTSGDDSDSYFRKSVTIKKLPAPTPDKFIIEGEFFPRKEQKSKRVRVRTRTRTKKTTFETVPYFEGPSSYVVPERIDVLMAAEQWNR